MRLNPYNFSFSPLSNMNGITVAVLVQAMLFGLALLLMQGGVASCRSQVTCNLPLPPA